MTELSNVGHRSWPITWLDMSAPGDSSHWSIDLLSLGPWASFIGTMTAIFLFPPKETFRPYRDLETNDPRGEEKPQSPDRFKAALLLGHSKRFPYTAGGISPVPPSLSLTFEILFWPPENQCPQQQNRWCSNLLADLSILLFQNGDRAGKESEIWTMEK